MFRHLWTRPLPGKASRETKRWIAEIGTREAARAERLARRSL